MKINSDVINLTAYFPFMMKYSDICSAIGIQDKYLYKLLKKKKFVHVIVKGNIRIPSSLFTAYLAEGDEFNRSKDFIQICYKESLSSYPDLMTVADVCDYLNVSKSTIKRVIAGNEIKIYKIKLNSQIRLIVKKTDLISYLMDNTIY